MRLGMRHSAESIILLLGRGPRPDVYLRLRYVHTRHNLRHRFLHLLLALGRALPHARPVVICLSLRARRRPSPRLHIHPMLALHNASCGRAHRALFHLLHQQAQGADTTDAARRAPHSRIRP